MRSLAQLLLTVLLNASWQIAVVTLFAACGSWLLRGTAAWCRHSVWVAALLISLCLPIISGVNALELSPIAKQELAQSEPEAPSNHPVELQEIELIGPVVTPIEMPVVQPTQQRQGNSPILVNRNL